MQLRCYGTTFKNMDIISDLNSDIALAVLLESRNRQKLDHREAIEFIFRVNSALEPLSHPNEKTLRTDIPASENNIANRRPAI